jgi:alpha-glucosidase
VISRGCQTRHAVFISILSAVVFSGGAAEAQWTTVGAMRPAGQTPTALTFRDGRSIVSITAVTPDIIRVRFSPAENFGRDHSYAVLPLPPMDASPAISVDRDQSVLATRSLRVTARHRPFRLTIADAAGEILDQDDPAQGMASSGAMTRAFKRLRVDEHVYGLGEKNGLLDKRGRQQGGYSYTMWNSDTFAYGLDTDPIYVAIPFAIVMRGGRAHGLFLDNISRTNFDIGHTSDGILAFGADRGDLDYYFINGPAPADVVSRYTSLTGRMPMPPRWALGYHQCRYSYYPESTVRFVAQNFRARHIPADAIWLDIHYMDSYKPFTWDPERFPDPPRLIGDLRAQGLRVVTIVDPHPKKEAGYQPYDTGLAGGHFVKNPDGSIYEAPVWPAHADRHPGPSVFPDFTRSPTRAWWGRLFAGLLDAGVAGIWNDMDEPAVFDTPTGTMPLDVRFDNDGAPAEHRAVHNAYGQLTSRATYEGLQQLRPDSRPFILTRATYAGGQRYAAVWAGDNVSEWSHLRGSIPLLLGMGLSGLPFVGVDIGGFAETPTAELYTRWLQLGVFYPFMRTHTTFGTPDQDPWSYGTKHEALNRRAIELRYELLPQIYNVMHDASVSGLPALRPLLLEFPTDPATYGLDDEFMFGRDLLVAPVLWPEAAERSVYLPSGTWVDFWTGARITGGASHRMPVTLGSIPMFARAGSFVFEHPVVQHTGELPGQPLRVMVIPGADGTSTLYEDDGETAAYLRGTSVTREFRQQTSPDKVTIAIGAPSGPFRPASRDLWLLVRRDAPAVVMVGGAALPRVTMAELASRTGAAWSVDEAGVVNVRLHDDFAATEVSIGGAAR